MKKKIKLVFCLMVLTLGLALKGEWMYAKDIDVKTNGGLNIQNVTGKQTSSDSSDSSGNDSNNYDQSSEQSTVKKPEIFPATGDNRLIVLSMLGVLMFSFSLVFLIRNKKKLWDKN